jgi:23S rRNA pseudouridine1911/1915/1917 synthase
MPRDNATLIHIGPEQDQVPLGTALKRSLADKSWSQVRRLLETRHVQVNGNLCVDDLRRLNAGDVVKVHPHPLAPPPRQDDIKVRFLDKQVVVVEKPSGMTTLRHNEEQTWAKKRKDIAPTLDEVLPRVIAKLERRDVPARPTKDKRFPHGKRESLPQVRAVHRLDRDTSGLMIFARTIHAERHLVDQFRKHTTVRSYLAIVHGQPQAQTIETNLVRDRGDGRRGSAPGKDGQRAVTHVRPLETLGDYSLVECRLETGRTHQIRIHLSELGHYLCGDKVYSQPLHGSVHEDTSGAPRLALHAQELGFMHPLSGQQVHFTTPLPPDLQAFLDRLRKRQS